MMMMMINKSVIKFIRSTRKTLSLATDDDGDDGFFTAGVE